MTGAATAAMLHHPPVIHASVNGMSTRLPDGARQLLGGWSQDPARPGAMAYRRADLCADAPEDVDFIAQEDPLVARAMAALAEVIAAREALEAAQQAHIDRGADSIARLAESAGDVLRRLTG